MNPILLLLGGGAAFAAYKGMQKKPVQGTTIATPAGVPVHVVTPVPAAVTPSQVAATPVKPPVPAPSVHQSVPHVTQSSGVVYAPPAAVTQVAPGVVQLAPIVITPSGAASVAISTLTDVQKALNTLGFGPVAEDGKLGPQTIAAIRAFQGKNNLVVDGNAGPATKTKLSEALTKLASSGPATSAVLAAVNPPAADAVTGTTGTPSPAPAPTVAVVTNKDVQHALNLLGANPPLQEDGVLGPKSVAAIKTFQLTHGLVADGVAGPKTKTGLAAALQAKGVSMHGDWHPAMSGGQFGSCWA
jgi:peptidoglycan hydrolase-like protein with peptidoglycan-binding domain